YGVMIQDGLYLYTPELHKDILTRYLCYTPKNVVKLPNGFLDLKVSYRDPNYRTHLYMRQQNSVTCFEKTLEKFNIEPERNTHYIKVTSIEESESEVFDIEVEGCHSYTVNGIVSHNTINLPKETTEEELSGLLLDYIRDLKGVTVYRDGSRSEQVLNHMSDKEVRDHLAKKEEFTTGAGEESVQCAGGKCEI
ncbi:unnamed protein product, partial [marine sediment metagenome]